MECSFLLLWSTIANTQNNQDVELKICYNTIIGGHFYYLNLFVLRALDYCLFFFFLPEHSVYS